MFTFAKNKKPLSVRHVEPGSPYNGNRMLRVQTFGARLAAAGIVDIDNTIADELEGGCLTFATEWMVNSDVPPIWDDDRFVNAYNITCTRVQQYVEGPQLPGLAARLAYMTSEEVWPTAYAADRAALEEQLEAKVEKKYSAQFGECRQCHQSYATGRRVQMASLDEGEHIFVECGTAGCGGRWTLRA